MQRTALSLALALALTGSAQAANHREAPITALDHKADITDLYAFRSYDGAVEPRVTLIMGVDPLLEPANGPNWFPFDPDITYEIKIDNDHDAIPDLGIRFTFDTEQRLPGLFQVYAGVAGGANAPFNSPPLADNTPTVGSPVVPDRIDSFDDAGLGQIQRYRVQLVRYKPNGREQSRPDLVCPGAEDLPAVPANVGPRTMDYSALFDAGIHTLPCGVTLFAGTTDDAFWIDLGGAFDTFNTHIFPVLSDAQEAAAENFAPDTVSGYAVNHLAIEVPVSMLTRTGQVESANSSDATIGVWATTSRPRITLRHATRAPESDGSVRQVQRMGNPLINELIIGTGAKDRFSIDQPVNDGQFANFLLDPSLARVINALTNGAVAIPAPPRTDLLPLVTYAPPIAAPGTPPGPVADLLRLNTGVAPTPPAAASRMGLLGGDPAGFPNGRRVFDDVTDSALRVVVGGVLHAPFDGFDPSIGGRLGDGVNVNDVPYRTSFPYVGEAPSGRDRRHLDPGEPGCTAGGGADCPS